MKIYQIEVTNYCNLRCSFCPIYEKWADRSKGFMNLDLLDHIDFMETDYVELQFGGEPALHPNLTQIAGYIRSLDILVGISTNSTLPIDFDAFDIITTTRDKERNPSQEFIHHDNVHLQILGETHPYEDYSHAAPSHNPDIPKCTTPWTHISIHWDGDVVPCCHCYGKQHVFGNLYDKTMEEIVNSHKRTEFLRDFPFTYICRYCNFPNPHLIHEELLEERRQRCGQID